MASLSLACSRTVMDEMCLICFANKENNNCLSFIIDDIELGGGTRNMNVKRVMKENVYNNLERQDEI